MLIRREGFGGESRRASLARRLEAVAEIRRMESRRTAMTHRYDQDGRYVTIEQHQPGQDAA